MKTTKLGIDDQLPLTCSRTGTCCHGKAVLINPWELVCLAKGKGLSAREFRDRYTEFGGIRLRFDGLRGWKDQAACSQYVAGFGCSVHEGRPLACRLYPLGRQLQNDEVHYMYEGAEFPCLDGCPEVEGLPRLRVGEYLKGQKTDLFEQSQDAYLDLMQNLADVAFVLLLDTGLADSGDQKTLPLWRAMGSEAPEALAERIGAEWMDALMLPEITDDVEDPISFAQQHNDLLQSKAQERFGVLDTYEEWHEASVLMMGLALHLARGIGADPKALADHWVDTAKGLGGME